MALTRRGDLNRHDLGLKRRCQLLRLGQPKSKISQASLLIALDAGHLSLRHDPRPKLRHQLHPPHQLRHPPTLVSWDSAIRRLRASG